MPRKIVSIECDNCGAKVPAKTTYGSFTCEYCDHRFRIEPPSPPRVDKPRVERPPPPQPRPRQHRPRPPRRRARKGGVIAAVMSLLLTFGGGILAWVLTSGTMDRVTSVISQVKVSSTTGGGLLALGERVLWDNVGGAPVPVTIGEAEHVLGRIRDMNNDGQLSIRVYESATLRQRWRTPDLGTYSEAYRGVHYAAVEGRVLVTDKENVLHIYQLEDGKELGSHQLTDRADQLCSMPEGNRVWVQLTDQRHIFFDAQRLTSMPAPRRPPHCPRSVFVARHSPPRVTGRRVPRVAGLRPKRLFVDGGQGVVYGAKRPGTPIPTAAGFDPGTRRVSWTKPVVQVAPTSYRDSFERFHADLAGGRFVAAYGVGTKSWHVGALDAQTGDPLWDVALRELFAVDRVGGVVATAGFVYVERTSSLDVLAAGSGKQIGTIGVETYAR